MIKDKALAICKKPISYWDKVKELRALGINLKRAKRMATRAKQGMFMWEGVKVPLDAPDSKPLSRKEVKAYRRKSEQKD